MPVCVGIDFGTTNSALAFADTAGGAPRLVAVDTATGPTRTFRSVLYFDPDERGPDRRPLAVAGPDAIERYLTNGVGRLIQSAKSYLASRSFTSTSVLHYTYTLEDLIALIVGALVRAAERAEGPLPPRVVVGRPVRFAGADAEAPRADASEDDGGAEAVEPYAVGRLRAALAGAGLADVVFEYEPVAAAYHYESRLERDELVLIADFGGGTSDFCVIRVGPGVRARGRRPEDILGTDGVGVAGDAFDSRV
jgi:hypothetical chaperone protein